MLDSKLKIRKIEALSVDNKVLDFFNKEYFQEEPDSLQGMSSLTLNNKLNLPIQRLKGLNFNYNLKLEKGELIEKSSTNYNEGCKTAFIATKSSNKPSVIWYLLNNTGEFEEFNNIQSSMIEKLYEKNIVYQEIMINGYKSTIFLTPPFTLIDRHFDIMREVKRQNSQKFKFKETGIEWGYLDESKKFQPYVIEISLMLERALYNKIRNVYFMNKNSACWVFIGDQSDYREVVPETMKKIRTVVRQQNKSLIRK